jgi:hypothetical protein
MSTKGQPRRPYKPAFNVQAYNVIDRVDLGVRETHPSREIIDLYSENAYYGGVSFLFDNIGKIIWGWISNYAKKREWAKKIAGEKNPAKFEALVKKTLEEELNVQLTGYTVKRVEEGNHPNDFEELFLYEIQDFDLFNKHYYRADVEMLMPQETPKSQERVNKCPKCGWIISKGKNKCPRCQTVIEDAEPVKDEAAEFDFGAAPDDGKKPDDDIPPDANSGEPPADV